MRISKSRNIVDLYRIMSMLKLKIIVKPPQLLCIVVSAAQYGGFERQSTQSPPNLTWVVVEDLIVQ